MYNVIIFLVIIFDEKIYDVKCSVLYYHITNFTTFMIAFADNVINFCITQITYFHISDFMSRILMRAIGGKVKGQRRQIKNKWLLYSSPEPEVLQLSYLDRCPSSVISRVSVLCHRIFALIWQ